MLGSYFYFDYFQSQAPQRNKTRIHHENAIAIQSLFTNYFVYLRKYKNVSGLVKEEKCKEVSLNENTIL